MTTPTRPEATLIDANAFQRSRTVWNALVDRMQYPTMFSTWEWVSEWFSHFGNNVQPFILFVRRGHETVAILPLYLRYNRLGRDGRTGRILEYCGARELYPDPLDIIASPADAAAGMDAVLSFLACHATAWDVLHLQFATVEGALGRYLEARGTHRTQSSVAPFVRVTGTYDDYVGSLSANERSNVRRRRRKLMEGQGFEYTNFAENDRREVLDRLFDLHARRAVQKNIRSSFDSPQIRAFHAALLCRVPPERVWLRGFRRDGEILAVFYGFSLGGRLSYYQLGFDPDFEGVSLGSALLQETIRESFASGLTEYNFLQGDESFKFRWAREARTLHAFDIFNTSWRGQLSRALILAKEWLRRRMHAPETASKDNPH